MTAEQLLLSALSGVSSALIYVCTLLWTRSKQCELELASLRQEYEKLAEAHGVATGTLSLYRRCRVPVCPFADMTPAPAGARP